jgi:hypothetical protein
MVGDRRALCLAHGGRLQEAQEMLRVRMDQLTDDALEEETVHSLCGYFEAAILLGDQNATAHLYPKFDGLTAVQMNTRTELSNIARHLGDAARLLGDPAAATDHYRRSLDWATALRYRPEIALTRLGIAELLLDGAPEERAEAQSHLDFAIEEFRAMKMPPSLERALRHKGLLHA